MQYDDLTIEVRSPLGDRGDATCRVEVLSDAFGRGSASFSLPMAGETLRLLRSLEARLAREALSARPGDARRHVASMPTGELSPPPPTARELGTTLFHALFQGEALRVLDRCLAHQEASRAESGEDRGVRLRFVFDPSDAEMPELAAVPWELLFRPEARRFLARSGRTPIVRTVAVPIPARRLVAPLSADRAFRVLLVEASPRDQESLATGEEADAVEEALGRLDHVEVVRVSHADLGPLYWEHLRRGGFHALHFMGHGDFIRESEDREVAVLCFERPDGTTRRVPADLFAEHVEDAGTVRLVVLNACLTAAMPRPRGQDPFTAAATALVIAGIPAVVAMQLPISDRAAVAFATGLYRALGERDSLSSAVAAGRLAICQEDPESLEWATPVLYLHGDDRVFEEGAEPRPAPGIEPGASEPREERPLRLGVRSMDGLAQDLEAKADRRLSLLHHFDGRAIRDPELWHQAVLPELESFLSEAHAAGRPILLDFAAHQSLAFAAGRFLEAKSGIAVSVVQRGLRGTEEWFSVQPGAVPEGPLWQEPESQVRDSESHDMAAAVSVTHPALQDAEDYLETSSVAVRRILHVAVHSGPSPRSVRDGAHALLLAHALARLLRGRTREERRGTLHLFAAAPNALLVFLGQLSPALGAVQLYEYDFPEGPYWPSFLLGGGA